MEKLVKNEQWTIRVLISKISNNEIIKPKFQRKKKWDILPKKENNPNEKTYIEFLFEIKNSVHAITFGQNMDTNKITYTNIDGNNRINAIKHFIDKPFEIFPEYLNDLFKFINTLSNLEQTDTTLLKDMFSDISYTNIIEMKFYTYFESINKQDLYIKKLKIHRDEFDVLIDKIKSKLSINNKDRFDIFVTINVNLFEGYNTDELCKIFEDINKFNSKLTDIELLACRLYNITDFLITDNIIEQSINNEIIKHYEDKTANEALICYSYNNDLQRKMNAFDFIIGFQNHCNTKYKVIEKSDNIGGMSLFFKLYKNIYNTLDKTFNNQNVNDFIDKMSYSCNILKKIYDTIFTENINNKLFNSTCETKFLTLKKNSMYMIMSSIFGYKNIGTSDNDIIRSIEKTILYHFLIEDLKVKKEYNLKNTIHYLTGGTYIDAMAKKYYNNPHLISEQVNKNELITLINQLFKEGNDPKLRLLPNGRKNDKRRLRKFYEKCLLFYYYKSKVPTNLLNNKFSLEHIYPFCSNWDSGEIDIDRIGNVVPIIDEINNKRNNKHISKYVELDVKHNFINFIDIIPNDNTYNLVISHDEKCPKIINIEKYNEQCKTNEKKYLDNFIKCLKF